MEPITNLCQLAGVQKIRTSLYHPQTNGQCKHFNSTLINMLDTRSPEWKNDWRAYVPILIHAYYCTKNAATGYSLYYLFYGREPGLPIDNEFGLQKRGQKLPPSNFYYVEQL